MKQPPHEEHIPHDSEKPLPASGSPGDVPGEIHHDIADADKRARTGGAKEPVRSTPPAGKWNDVAPNE